MTTSSTNCRRIFIFSTGGIFLSIIVIWHLIDFGFISPIENENLPNTATTGNSNFPMETFNAILDNLKSTEENSTDDNNPMRDFKNLSMNYFLWSHSPFESDWTQIASICPRILFPPKNRDDSNYTALVDLARNWTIPYSHDENSMSNLLSNCVRFFELVPFSNDPLSREESEFPLAYVLVAARNNLAQFLRLFRNLYQPQNFYCITYDNKTSDIFKQAIKNLVNCFSDRRVFLNSRPENIYYTDYSILSSVTKCLKILNDKNTNELAATKWRYVQIVSWNDFPLRTNYEMVRIFQIFNGSQDSALDRNIEGFYVFYHDLVGNPIPHLHKSITPDGLTMYKGSYATSMSSDFVKFLFENPSSQKLYRWLNGSKCAEEQYWVTLIHNLRLNPPGAFPGECLHFYEMRGRKKPFVSRYQIWTFSKEKCRGKYTNFSCVYGVRDLADLIRRPELMAHKIYEEFESAASFCLEQWYWRRVERGIRVLNESYYENFPSVRYHRLRDKNEFVC